MRRKTLKEKSEAMNWKNVLMLGGIFLGAHLAGCRSAEKGDVTDKIDIRAAMDVPGDKVLREWKKIFSVEQRAKDKTRTQVGFLERRFSDEDREGKFFVRDKVQDLRGFVLPEGKAFVFELRNSELTGIGRDLGNTGLENGVKRILEVPGGIEFEPVTEASAAPNQG